MTRELHFPLSAEDHDLIQSVRQEMAERAIQRKDDLTALMDAIRNSHQAFPQPAMVLVADQRLCDRMVNAIRDLDVLVQYYSEGVDIGLHDEFEGAVWEERDSLKARTLSRTIDELLDDVLAMKGKVVL